jgi:glyoxalase-like protein
MVLDDSTRLLHNAPMTPHLSRRNFLLLAATLAAIPRQILTDDGIPTMLDHILLGVKDLDEGISFIEKKSGVRAIVGGSHPGAGTRNALISLGAERYLEIIAPDPQQSSAPNALHTGLADLRAPTLIGWAIHTHDIAGLAANMRKAAITFDGPLDGSRKRPDGLLLQWKTLRFKDDRGGSLPFFIEWGKNTPHPSVDAPSGCRLESFSVASPNPAELRQLFHRVGVAVTVDSGAAPQLSARFEATRGTFELAS